MELIETLGLDDLGRTLVRTCVMDGDVAVVMVIAYVNCTAEIVHQETLTGDAAQLIAKKYAEYLSYQKIRDDFNRGTRLGSHAPNIQQLPKGKSPDLLVYDEVVSVPVESSRMTSSRHHKRKPQPNRGPIGRKEWT